MFVMKDLEGAKHILGIKLLETCRVGGFTYLKESTLHMYLNDFTWVGPNFWDATLILTYLIVLEMAWLILCWTYYTREEALRGGERFHVILESTRSGLSGSSWVYRLGVWLLCRQLRSEYIVKFAGGAVSWSSRLQECIVVSAMEVEYVATSKVCKEALWLS